MNTNNAIAQLADWCAELADLVAQTTNDTDPAASDRAAELRDRIQRVADAALGRPAPDYE